MTIFFLLCLFPFGKGVDRDGVERDGVENSALFLKYLYQSAHLGRIK